MRAVDEWIAIPPVARIIHLAQAILANKIIRRNMDVWFAGLAGENTEAGVMGWGGGGFVCQYRPGDGGRFADECFGKSREIVFAAFGMNFHRTGHVAHPAVQVKPVRQPVDKRPVADALYPAGNQVMTGNNRFMC